MNPDRGEPAAWLDAPGWYKMHRIIWSIDGISPCITTCAGGNVKPNIYIPRGHRMKIQNATEQGWLEADPGDGIVLNFLGRARGRVQKERSPTLHTDGGGVRESRLWQRISQPSEN